MHCCNGDLSFANIIGEKKEKKTEGNEKINRWEGACWTSGIFNVRKL